MPVNRHSDMSGMDGLIGDAPPALQGHVRGFHGLSQTRPQVSIFHHEPHGTLTEIVIAKLHDKGRRGFAGGAIADLYFEHRLGVMCQILPQSQRVEHFLTGGRQRV